MRTQPAVWMLEVVHVVARAADEPVGDDSADVVFLPGLDALRGAGFDHQRFVRSEERLALARPGRCESTYPAACLPHARRRRRRLA